MLSNLMSVSYDTDTFELVALSGDAELARVKVAEGQHATDFVSEMTELGRLAGQRLAEWYL